MKFRVLILALLSCLYLQAAEEYHWESTQVDDSAQLLTLFSSSGTPLVAVLRDNLGSPQLNGVWLLTDSSPSWEKRVVSAVPFLYYRIGRGSSRVGKNDLKPLINLDLPQRSGISGTVRNILQWTVLDPLSTPVRASTRAYQTNFVDDERLHIQEAKSYFQAAPTNYLSETERDAVIARLDLRSRLLGDFVSSRQISALGESANIELERTRARNWELLRQCADKTGLLFEAIDLAGTKEQYAVLWYPVDRKAPPQGTRLGPVWKLLNVSDPYAQRPRLLEKPAYERFLNRSQQAVVPLGVYSLTYPKMPLLMIDFNDRTHVKRHEMTQRAINEVTAGVIGISHFTNWYYFIAADLYDFYQARRGTATNQQERLNSYSQFRVALQLDQSMDAGLRSAMQQRVNSLSVNPLDAVPQKEIEAASQRYALLRAAATDEDGRLLRRLDKDRRNELARFEQTKWQATQGGVFHYATLGLYSRRAGGDDYLERLAHFRQVESDLAFLEKIEAADTDPEVAYEAARIQRAVSELASLLPDIHSQFARTRAELAIKKLDSLSMDDELRAECVGALDVLHGTSSGGSGFGQGTGAAETLR